MLLKFEVTNYKSFKEKSVLDLTPAPKQKDLEYSILLQDVNNTEYKALSSSVIYGPNASGKTNIIGAIEVLKDIILRGNIKNSVNDKSFNTALHRLDLIPNNSNISNDPVDFFISYIFENKKIDYRLSLDFGLFMDRKYERKVLNEELSVNNEQIFIRKLFELKLNQKHLPGLSPFGDNISEKSMDSISSLLSKNLQQDELFLTNGFKNILNSELANEILHWFKSKLTIIYRADSLNIKKKIDDNDILIQDDRMTNLAKAFGASSEEIVFYNEVGNNEGELSSVFERHKDNAKYILPSDMVESYGTIRFLNLIPNILDTFKDGGTIIIDEFDASIHPMALLNIINIFHNDEINTNNAQLIFNTHNPVFLKPSVFRRDEIKFVDKDNTGNSVIYSLADFGTSGESGVRATDDYMKNYFVDKYGAINEVDFSDIFKSEVEFEDEKDY